MTVSINFFVHVCFTEGSDFAPLNEQVTFQAGDESSLTQCIPLTIFGDDAVESEEVLQVLLTNSSISISSPSNQLITIADDDSKCLYVASTINVDVNEWDPLDNE